MKRSLVTLVVAATLVGAVAASSAPTRSTTADRAVAVSPFLPAPPLAGPRQIVFYGHARSLVRKGVRYELRFDPALFLTGVTANRAAEDDKVIAPGEGVPNDYYIRDESRRVLTYVMPTSARVTVITNGSRGFRATRVPVAELDRILAGENPRSRKLYGPRLGFWVRVESDTVRSLDQQYQP
jgi:hypothetical protein